MTQGYWDKVSEDIRREGVAEITAPNRIITSAEIAAHDDKGYKAELDRSYETDCQKSYNDKNVSRMKGGSLVTVSILALLMLVLLCAAPLVL